MVKAADVIIVGAGPSGSACAIELVRKNLKVLLLEKKQFPRDKACGDALSPHALSLLGRLEISTDGATPISRGAVRSPTNLSQSPIVRSYQVDAAILPRAILDDRLATRAADLGADLRCRTNVESLLVEDGSVVGVRARNRAGNLENLFAPVTIVAEGAVDKLSRQSPIYTPRPLARAYLIRSYYERIQASPEPAIEIYTPLEAGGYPVAGYAWIFSVKPGVANVGLGFIFTPKNRPKLSDLISSFESQLIRLDPRFADAKRIGPPLGAPMLFGGRGETSHAPGLLCVGDAAGLPDPLWAEGIGRALESGMLAADVAYQHLGSGDPLSTYAAQLYKARPHYDRIAPSLELVYRNMARMSRDMPEFFQHQTPLSRAFSSILLQTPPPALHRLPYRGARPPTTTTKETIEEIRWRARTISGRDRPLYGEISDRLMALEDAPLSPSPFLVSAYEALAADSDRCSVLIRAGVGLELMRVAAFSLSSINTSVGTAAPSDSRGATWINAAISLSLADRLIARVFSVVSHLPDDIRIIASSANREIISELTASALSPDEPVNLSLLLGSHASRIGALIAGASREEANAFFEAAFQAMHDCEDTTEILRKLRTAFAAIDRHPLSTTSGPSKST